MKYLKDLREKYPDLDSKTSQQVIEHIREVIVNHSGHYLKTFHLLFDRRTGMLSRFVDLHPATGFNGSILEVGAGRPATVENNILITLRIHTKDTFLNLEVIVPRSYHFENRPASRWTDLKVFVEDLKTLKLKCPVDFSDQKLGAKVVATDISECYARGDWSRFTDFGRPVAVINALLKQLGSPPLPQDVTNPMLTKIQNICENASYVCKWTEKTISKVYHEGDRGDHGSCMSGKPHSYFELYDHLQNEGRLRLIELHNAGGIRYGRALCWFGENPAEKYLDRLYVPMTNGMRDPDAVEAFRTFIQAEGITKTVWGDNVSILGLEHRERVHIPVGVPYTTFDQFPYIDSMCYWFSDNTISNSDSRRSSGAYSLGEMQNTDGSTDFHDSEDDENYVTMYDGGRAHVDDAYLVNRVGDYYYSHEVIEVGDDWELRDECRLLNRRHYGWDEYAHSDDATEIHDGTFVRDEDAVELHDGTFAHEGDAVEVSGEFYLYGDEAIVEVDGVWKLVSELEESEEPV